MVVNDQQTRSKFTISTPWYHGWNILAITLLLQGIILGLMTYSFTLWIIPFRDEFGAAQGTILLAASLSNAGMGVLAPFLGRLLDKHSIRLLIVIGVIIYGVGFFLISLCTSIWQIIIIYATLLPLGTMLAGPLACQVMVARWFEKNRGMALGLSSIGSSTGGVILPPVVAALILATDWRVSHMILAVGAVAIVIPLVCLFIRNRNDQDAEPGKSRQASAEGFEAAEGSKSPPLPDVFPDWKASQILRSRTLWVLISFVCPMMLVATGIQFNIAPISQEAGIDPQHAAFVVSTASLTMIIGKLAFGFLSDYIEHRFIIWMSSAFMLICLILLQFASSYWVMMVAIGFLGLASGGMMPVLGVIIASRFGAPNFGRVNGILAPFTTIFAFGPVGIGYLRAGLDSYNAIYLLLMVMVIPTVIGAFFLRSAVPEIPGGGSLKLSKLGE